MKQEKQEQESNKILLQKKKPNKAMTRKRTQIGVEYTKSNEEFYLYLYPLST